MDTRQLQTFITLSETLNYQRAADQLQYAPSSLFKHIQLLEEEIGLALFVKRGRQLELTREGKRFLPDAKRMLGEWEDVLRAAREVGEMPALSICGCELNTSFAVRGLLQEFISAYPEMRFTIMTSPNADVPDILNHAQADLSFYYSTSEREVDGLQSVTLYSEPVVLMVSGDHPLLEKERVTWEDLAGFPVFHPHDTCVFFRSYTQQLSARGLAPGGTSFLGNMALVAEQARKSASIMLVPYMAQGVMQEMYGIEPIAFTDPSLRFWERIQYRRGGESNPSIRRMIRFAVHYADAQIAANPGVILAPEARQPLGD